jgi:hypothetical protein
MVRHRDVAVLESVARLLEHVWGAGHRFLTAGDHDVDYAGPKELTCKGDCVKPDRHALLIVRAGADIGMPPATAGRLAGRDLAAPGREHLAHDHVLHLIAGDPGSRECTLDSDPA